MRAQGATELSVSLGTPSLGQCALRVDNFTGSTVSVSYRGLPGDRARSYGQFVAIWQATIIPWTEAPIAKMTIPEDSESGSIVLSNLSIVSASYIVGFGTGPSLTTIAASALVSAGGLRDAPTSVAIGINAIGSTSLSVHYRTLTGALPRTYGHHLALWKGYASPYNAPKPLADVAVDSDSSEGDVGVNDVLLAIKTTYTLAYFTGKEVTSAAAILTFDTSSPPGG